MLTLKKMLICILFSGVLTGCGLGSVQNLHILDRIPHEKQKGYVTFSSSWTSEATMQEAVSLFGKHGVLAYQVSKKEFNHKVPITIVGGLNSGITTPITEIPGEHTFIIEYPSALGYPGMDDEIQREVFGEGISLIVKDFSGKQFPYYRKTNSMEIKVNIQKDQTTHITFNGDFKIHKKGTPKSGPFLIELSASPNGSILKALTGFEVLENACGPKIYKSTYQNVFDKTIIAMDKLDWEILSSDREKGIISIIIKRFPAEPFLFTIGINDMESGSIRVDVSSDAWWQRWGSINTNMSLEKIKELYNTLDTMI